MVTPPLILTLRLDNVSQAYFNDLRIQHFPAAINYIPAHVSLFHHLPSDDQTIQTALKEMAAHQCLTLEVTNVRNIGNGTAFIITSPELQMMHKQMQLIFAEHLIPQDRQKLWPHITIQNKVSALQAKQTTDALKEDFKPFIITGIGITAWFYLNGPWQKKEDFMFER